MYTRGTQDGLSEGNEDGGNGCFRWRLEIG